MKTEVLSHNFNNYLDIYYLEILPGDWRLLEEMLQMLQDVTVGVTGVAHYQDLYQYWLECGFCLTLTCLDLLLLLTSPHCIVCIELPHQNCQ